MFNNLVKLILFIAFGFVKINAQNKYYDKLNIDYTLVNNK
jgi:hypothetical protein